MNRLVISFLISFLLLGAFSPNAGAVLVFGIVMDSAGTPIDGVRVKVYNENPFPIPDFLIEEVFADANGLYVTPNAELGEDIYVIVSWEWKIPVSPNGSVVRLLDCEATACIPAFVTFTEKREPVTGSIEDITTDLGLPVIMAQVQPANLAVLGPRVNHVLKYIDSKKGSVAWSANYDIPIHLRVNAAFAAEEVNIPTGSLGAGTFLHVTLYHEVAHKVNYEFNDNAFPPITGACADHTVASEETRECAFVEGWATYHGQLAAEDNGVADPQYTSYRDPGNCLWRGNEGNQFKCDPGDTGFDGGTWESGEITEAANASVWFGIHATAAFSFADNLRVMIEDKVVNHMWEFTRGFIADVGAGSAGARTMHAVLQDHGFVYSRARLQTPLANLFDEDAPPNDAASMEDGNVKLIGGEVHLRGTVTVNMDEVPKADLGVFDTVDLDEIRLDWRAASDGTADSPFFPNMTPFVNFGLTNDDVSLDTTTMGLPNGDGQWDLLAVGKNEDGATDKFTPTWNGDATNSVDSDEKYLKKIGAWFDFDRDAATNTNPGGRVTVDNESPIADPTTFKPQ